MKPWTPILTLVGALLAAPVSLATPITFNVALDGPSEEPANDSPGSGTAIVTIDVATHQLVISVSFSGLTGTTTASHIHCCAADPGAGIIGVATETPTFGGFPLGVTSGTYDNTYDTTLLASFNAPFVTNNGGTAASAEAALFQGIQDGRAYLNIHSTVFPGGEIRGFLVQAVAVPEPAGLALVSLGLLCAGLTRRRRRTGGA